MISAVTPAVQQRTNYREHEQDYNMKAAYKDQSSETREASKMKTCYWKQT